MRHTSVRAILFTSTILVAAPLLSTFAYAQETTDLDDIVVGVPAEDAKASEADVLTDIDATGTTLDQDNPANSGQTTLGDGALRLRGSGVDANSALVGLPNVHARSDVNEDGRPADDIGEDANDILDLQPTEFSISGARINENNIMVDGVGVNSIVHPTGTLEPDDVSNVPTVSGLYGAHSQTQYIPSTLVDEVEVLDSNVSAEFGGFLGGAVNYKLRKPDLDEAGGSVSYSFQNEDFTKYSLGTEDGENPQNRNKPKWTKQNFAIDYSMPVSENTALLFGYTTQRATAEKQRLQQYGGATVDSESQSDFYRFAVTHETDNGDRLTGALNYTNYEQQWDLPNTANTRLDIENKALLGEFTYERDLDDLAFLTNTKLDLGLSFQRNEVANVSGQNTMFSWWGMDFGGNDLSANIDGCDPVAGGGFQNCFIGGVGDRHFEDDRIGLSAKLTGDLGNGVFKAGIAAESYDVNRRGTGYTLYTAPLTFGAGTCTAGDPSCVPEQYFFISTSQEAYDADVVASQLSTFVEADQTFGSVYLRGGLRADYNDVLENTDIAPRLTASWQATDDLSITVGANRYYDDNYLAYAVQDAIPGSASALRTFGDPTSTFGNATASTTRYSDSGLDTPYNDELSLAVAYQDDFTGGFWRLRALHRDGKDLFDNEGSSSNPVLTNGGSSEFDSVTLEYQKTWTPQNSLNLDGVGLYTSLTWSDSSRVGGTYFSGPGFGDNPVRYNGRDYERSEWDEVQGNLDQPLKALVELRSQWFDGGMSLGVAADLTAAYDGVVFDGVERDAATNQLFSKYVDHDFDELVLINLNASFRVLELQNGKDLMLDVKVDNLFDKRRSGTSSDSSPWVAGRTLWVGSTLTF
ncbi:hypothetical protein [Thalassobius sp. Cn5-15]|uniref:hypothetical protein n=1 Tax=Thalassobius sp. Cn5-15 TaxID=2917763 RepID=UPI001EF3A3CC|nr:hypothetical protein [Thalassobius sp. Cn5-15]MCG7494400.1 hypothetical protein [Thalassobius sp. Cn5-15]